jgi:hypothetical protein
MRGVVVLKAETACPGRSRASPDQITICMTAANVCSGSILLRKSLAVFLRSDSVELIRFATEADDDGAAQ